MRRLPVVLVLLAALGMGLIPGVASAYPTVYESGVVNVPIPDLTTVFHEMSIPAAGVIADVDVSMVINHTYPGDLVLVLTHVSTGRSVTLLSHQCGGTDNLDVTFDDEGAVLVCAGTSPGVRGVVRPGELLAAFDGEDLAGTWRLTVRDEWGADAGTLVSWALRFELGGGGRIIVSVATTPADAPAVSFAFDSSWGSAFTLAGGAAADSGALGPGTYAVWQQPPLGLGWSLVSASCDDGSSPAGIQVSPGETVTCTFGYQYQTPPLCFGMAATIVGTAGADRLFGTSGDDVIVGLGGNDRINGLAGNDRICGGPGADQINGGLGNDWVRGGAGADTLIGWQGDDLLDGGAGADLANGGPGTDTCLSGARTACELPPVFYTTAGVLTEDQVGSILAHQHMFVEFGVEDPVAYLDATPEEVYAVIGPMVEEVRDLGYSVFVDPTMEGVGRRPDIVEYVADRAGLPTMMVTGFYWDPYLPDWVRSASVAEIRDWLLEELDEGVGDTDVRAGWIKLSQSWGGITGDEMKVLRAACAAARQTGASIGSHILSGSTALAVIDALEGFGCDPSRFIWIHAPYTAFTEEDGVESLLAAAEAGAYLSLDFIGSNFWAGWLSGHNENSRHIELLQTLVDAGYEDQIIIGSDTGWYDPGFPAGFVVEPYDQIMNSFLPDLEAAGFSAGLIQKLMHDNPWEAYSR